MEDRNLKDEIKEQHTGEESDPTKDDAVRESDPTRESDAAKESDAVRENDPVRESDVAKGTDPVRDDDASGKNKEITLDVNMNAGVLYDYMLNHAYSGASGILGTCFGFLGIVFFARTHFPLYLIMGLLLIFYLPVHLRYRAAVQMQATDTFKKPLHYVVDVNGISVSQEEQTQCVSWEQCLKAVSTRKSIVVYTGKNNATIFPRADLGEYTAALIAVIAENMDPKRVKIRY